MNVEQAEQAIDFEPFRQAHKALHHAYPFGKLVYLWVGNTSMEAHKIVSGIQIVMHDSGNEWTVCVGNRPELTVTIGSEEPIRFDGQALPARLDKETADAILAVVIKTMAHVQAAIKTKMKG